MMGKQTGGNYYTYLWFILMPFFRLFGMEWTCLIVHFINIYLIFLAVYFLTKRVFDSLTGFEDFQALHQKLFFGISIPVLLTLVLLLTKKFVAGVLMVTIEPYLHPRNIALIWLIFALERFLKGRRVLAFCLVGLAANIHLLSAGIILFCFLIATVFDKNYIKWKSFLLSFLGFILCSSPVWIWILLSAHPSNPGDISNQNWQAILHYRTGYLFPQLWDRNGWLALLSVLMMFSVGYYSAPDFLPNGKKLFGINVGLLLLILNGIVFSELLPVPWLLSFQPIRSIQFLIIISIILIVPYLIKLWETDWIGKLWSIGLGFGIFLFEPMTNLIFLVISLIYLALSARLLKKMKLLFPLILGLSILVALPFLWSRVTSKIPKWINFAKGNQSFSQTFLNYVQLPGMTKPSAWQEVQLWAKVNSSKDSIWLTPPYYSGFRLRSQRSTVVEWKDGAMSLFNPNYANNWYQRLQDFGINFKTPYNLHPVIYQNLGYPQFAEIANKYNAKFVVVEKPKMLPALLLYSNTQFNVYHVRNYQADSL
jgi:hypothetical protein